MLDYSTLSSLEDNTRENEKVDTRRDDRTCIARPDSKERTESLTRSMPRLLKVMVKNQQILRIKSIEDSGLVCQCTLARGKVRKLGNMM